MPDRGDVVAAAHRIAGRVHRTPVLTSRTLDEMLGVELHFKCENLQRVGAFKMRGATNAVQMLPSDVGLVATHSSGNHGAALALAARDAGIALDHRRTARRTPGQTRRHRTLRCRGGRVRTDACRGVKPPSRACSAAPAAVFVPPYDDERIIAAAGTAALELMEDCRGLDQVWVPVGGGGLAAGTVVAAERRGGGHSR